MPDIIVNNHQLEFNGHKYACAVGRGGVTNQKTEGDLKTPAGIFSIRKIMFRADRISNLVCSLPTTPINVADAWCDDVASPLYNTQVTLPFAPSHEKLWRDDNTYDIIVVLGYNDNPVVPGLGSAIFMHVAREGLQPTAGCIALSQPDLVELLAQITPDTKVQIAA